jgi:hypothetical protein
MGILLIALLGISLYHVFHQKQPLYQGQPLSFWLDKYPAGFSPVALGGDEMIDFLHNEKPTIDAAIRGIGPKAVPTLMRMLRAKDSRVWIAVVDFIQKHLRLKVKYIPAESRHFRAGLALQALGPGAKHAVPELIEIYNRNISDSSFFGAAQALAAIGPAAENAIPSVMRTLTNSDVGLRSIAISTLGGIHCQPELVVPALEPFLTDTNLLVRLNAVMALEQFGTNAQKATSTMAELADHPYPIGPAAARALSKIGPKAGAKAGVE